MSFWDGFKKQANLKQWAGKMWRKVPGVQHYIDKANDPAFKVKRVVGAATIGLGGTTYGLHKLTDVSPPKEVGPQQAGMAQY